MHARQEAGPNSDVCDMEQPKEEPKEEPNDELAPPSVSSSIHPDELRALEMMIDNAIADPEDIPLACCYRPRIFQRASKIYMKKRNIQCVRLCSFHVVAPFYLQMIRESLGKPRS